MLRATTKTQTTRKYAGDGRWIFAFAIDALVQFVGVRRIQYERNVDDEKSTSATIADAEQSSSANFQQ
jgi:hypothetical protein